MNIKKLLELQKQFLQNLDIKNLNKVNKILFEINEKAKKEKEKAKEKLLEEKTNKKICELCK